jgi:hypothetical protein
MFLRGDHHQVLRVTASWGLALVVEMAPLIYRTNKNFIDEAVDRERPCGGDSHPAVTLR